MLSTLLVQVGVPLLAVFVGWFAKKLHVEAMVLEVEQRLREISDLKAALLAKSEAVTPTSKPPR